MEAWMVWVVLVGVLIAAQLATGTVYLLMLAVGGVIGAIAAWYGASVTVQVLLGAMAGAAGTVVWSVIRKRKPQEPEALANPSVQMDIGQSIYVDLWTDGKSTRAGYRGSQWDIVYDGADEPGNGLFVIAGVQDNKLIVRRLPAKA